MSTAVVDASAMVDVIAAMPRHGRAREVVLGFNLIAPALIDGEVLSALARLERAGVLGERAAASAVVNWLDSAVERVPTQPLIPASWALRDRARLTDAFYVALAKERGVPLITSDARLARAGIPGLDIRLIA
jgi:predicted nucleic acid-binding protein